MPCSSMASNAGMPALPPDGLHDQNGPKVLWGEL